MVMPESTIKDKKCIGCKSVLALDYFHKNKTYSDGRSGRCKNCTSKKRIKHYNDNKEKVLKQSKDYYYNTLEYQSFRKKKHRLENLELYKERSSKWKKENRDKVASYTASRRAKLKTAMPIWLTKEQKDEIESIFSEARRLTESTGVLYQVDHIEPINGEGFTGLHVPWNLRVIPHYENESKGNKLINI